MMETTGKPTRVQRREPEIRALLKEQEQSDVTVKEFCEMYDIHEATFYNWRKKYNPATEKPAEFIALQLPDSGSDTSLFAEIELPGKALIRLYRAVEPSYFKALL